MIPRRVFFDPEGVGDDRARTGGGHVSTPPPGQWPPPPPPSHPMPGDPPAGPWGTQPQGQQLTGARASGNTGKWVLGGLAALVIVVVTVVATTLVLRGGSDSSRPPTPTADAPQIASANDRSPAGIILDDPTCKSWDPIAAAFAHAASSGWDDRDPAIPATNWNADMRSQYGSVGATLRDGADRSVVLAKETPHRVMRELYSQFIAYSRAYADAISNYTAEDDFLVRAAIGASSTLNAVCDAIAHGSAGARAPAVARAAPPLSQTPLEDPARADQFLAAQNPICSQWLARVTQFDHDISSWKALDPNVPRDQLNAEQRGVMMAVSPSMEEFSNDIQIMGIESGDPTLSDFATLSAQYIRAYISALPTYTPADNFLVMAASSSSALITEACRSSGA